MEIITPYIPSILILATIIITLILSWKGYAHFCRSLASKLDVLRIKKLAGNVTQEELDFLKTKKYPMFVDWKIQKKVSSKEKWLHFIEKIDIREELSHLNPFVVTRELARLQTECNNLERSVKSIRWSIDESIDRAVKKAIEPKKEPTPTPPPKKRGKFESELNPGLKVGGSKFI